MDLTPSTPQTSSGSSNDLASNVPDQELDAGSECGWRDTDAGARPIFYMGDEELNKYPAVSGLFKHNDGQKIRVGICAMSKKTNSKPMKEILARLERFENLQVHIFEEKVILGEPVERWPVVDALVSFFSTGFPLQKAIQYKNLYKPFVVNDLEAQYAIKDRREVYKILVREGISHPRYSVMNRDCEEKGDFDENEDAIDVNGTQFQRPFVEKPVDAEDHNIYIYFPVSAGGGCQKLFRKVGSRSSVYSQCNRVRKTGSFIYEDFMPTDGTDVKVYTVGPDYAHAEARKSPALDGKVERDKEGKEVRFPVLLSAAEKMIARKVCLAFKQNVCGFDLLRTGGKSYVCDVNGFSFVKNSTKYYDDCANVLGTMIIRALAPQLHIPLILGAAPEDIPILPTTSGSMMELRCVIAVIRHGDRTPKQKMKMEVKHKKFFDLFEKYNGYKKGHLKLKKPKQLQEVLDISRDLLSESHNESNAEVLEKKAKLRQLKLVLEMYEFSGINRKIQFKYQPYGCPLYSRDDEYPKEPSLVLIVKWGGELTPAGKFQAEDLGKAFRTLYPGGQGEFETPGLGFLRLHSTFRHDLKIYASDEGRVQMTAAAFTKGLLALEGELTPILVSMVKSANTDGLLDKEGETSKYQHIVKEKLMEILNQDTELNEEDVDRLAPTHNSSLINAIDYIKNPKKMCDSIYEMVCEITTRIKSLKMELKSRDLKLYHGESWELLIRRWSKLEKDYKLKTGSYDISKIPDIYDCIKYDLQHNQKTLQYARAQELFQYSKALADIVIPQEYGITVVEKVHISQSICTPLMRKIHSDLIQACQGLDEHSTRLNSKYSKGVASPERFVRTRLYFTSESHIHSLLNMLRYGGLCDDQTDEQWMKAMDFLSSTPELNYMTQINIMMFEDPTKESGSPEKFHVELHFSPGAYTSCDKSVVNPVSSGYRTSFLVKQAHKLKEGKEENSSSLLKDKLKDGLITEEIWEETSDDTMSGHNSIVLGEVNDRTIVLNESDINNFFTSTDKTESGDAKSHRDVSVGATNGLIDLGGEQIATNGLSDLGGELNKAAIAFGSKIDEELDMSEDIAEAIEVETTTITEHIDIDRSNKKDDIEITVIENNITEDTKEVNTSIPLTDDSRNPENSIEFPIVIKIKEAGDTESNDAKGVNVESSVSSLYLTAEEPDEDEIGTNEPNYLPSAEKHSKLDCPSSVVKVDDKTTDDHVVDDTHSDDVKVGDKITTIEDSKLEHVHPESSADDQSDIKGSNSSGSSADQSGIETDDDKLKKSVEIQSKHPINFPNTLNVQGFVSIPPREKRQTKDAEKENPSSEDDLKHNLLFPVDLRGVPEPKSPDPDIPEWDWGDEKVKDSSSQTDSDRTVEPQRPKSAGMISSLPINITACGSSTRRGSDPKKPYEESRSHSLEESDIKDGSLAFLEKHYRTIHLPINNDSHHSFSSLLYLNPDAFKAFDGFNMVPSLKPLETLHNNLTMKDLDGFLCRATTTKFFTPVSSNVTTPLPSPRCPELNRTKSSGPSLPSSSNSSAGPSSPTSASTPIDCLSRLKMYIIDSVKLEHGQTETDADLSSESSLGSTSQQQETNQATVIPQRKKPQVPELSLIAGPNPTDGLNMAATGHVSAFKAVSRSSGQKTQFLVTHVPEDSLKINKQEKNDFEETKLVDL